MKNVTGGGLPAETWKQFMQAAHHGVPPARLPLGGALPPVVIEGDGAQVGDPVAGLMRDLAPVPVSRDATGATDGMNGLQSDILIYASTLPSAASGSWLWRRNHQCPVRRACHASREFG
jgi:membrane peptidoglycan carboxypeptidase